MSSGRNASSSGINTVVGNHIRKRRLALNLTQEELAEMLGLEAFTICRFETGSRAPNLNRIEKLASILQCHISDFFWDHEIPLDSKLRKLERLMDTVYSKYNNFCEAEQAPGGLYSDCAISYFASRSSDVALRISGILAYANNPDNTYISPDCMQKACVLAKWYLHETIRIRNNGTGANLEVLEAKELLDWIKMKGEKIISMRQISLYGPNKFRKVEKLSNLLEILELYGHLEALHDPIINKARGDKRKYRVV